MNIPVCIPSLNHREKEILTQAIDDNWISSDGPYVKQFEKSFSNYCDAKYGVAVSSGTAALECALYGLGVKAGDEVIMPSFTIISCAIAALRLGAIPVLIDVDPQTWCLKIKDVEASISEKTKCIIAVHMFGHVVDIDNLKKVIGNRKIKILEDAAQVHGGTYKNRKCGSLGNAAAFSFYANKIITTGEGGMVVTSDPDVFRKAAEYRNLCFLQERRFYHENIGNNYRMTNLQAAIGIGQLEKIESFIQIKKRHSKLYQSKLKLKDGLEFQVELSTFSNVFWMHCVVLPAHFSASNVISKLADKGIGSRPFFYGLHLQPCLHNLVKFGSNSFEITERLQNRGLYLPSSVSLKDEQISQISDVFLELLG